MPKINNQNKLKHASKLRTMIPFQEVGVSTSLVSCQASFYRGKCLLSTIVQYHSRCLRSRHCSQTLSVHFQCQSDAAATHHAGETVQADRPHSTETSRLLSTTNSVPQQKLSISYTGYPLNSTSTSKISAITYHILQQGRSDGGYIGIYTPQISLP